MRIVIVGETGSPSAPEALKTRDFLLETAVGIPSSGVRSDGNDLVLNL